MTSKNSSMGDVARAATLVTALAGVAAGAYYLYGSPDAKKHRRQLSEWIAEARKELEERAGDLKDAAFDERNFRPLVEEVVAQYQQAKGLAKEEAAILAEALIEEWRTSAKRSGRQPQGRKTKTRKAKK